jgi:hypothetical protein
MHAQTTGRRQNPLSADNSSESTMTEHNYNKPAPPPGGTLGHAAAIVITSASMLPVADSRLILKR